MHGSKRRMQSTSAGRRFRFGLIGLAATFALILGQVGLVIANADTSRDRSAGTISTTTIVGGKGTNGGSTGSDDVASSTIATHPSGAGPAAAPAAKDSVTICHATASANNPYVQITVDVNGAGANTLNAHLQHTGPIFDPLTMTNGDTWGDIIPDHSDPPNNTPITSLNWSAAGQVIWAAGCKVPGVVPGALAIQKTGPAAGTVGTSFSYQITVSNTGGATVPGVTVTDAVPAGLTVTGVSFTNTGGGSGNCTAQQNVSCAVGDLAAGGSANVTIAVTPASCGTFNNNAGASSSDPFVAPVSTNAPVVTTVPCPAGPALSVTKTGPASVTPPDTFSYTVTVTNSGGTDTTATTVTDTVDPAFVVTSVTFTNSGGGSGTCTAQQGVSCNVGVIVANGGTATVTISGNVPVPASGLCPSVSNQASASATNATTASSNTVTTTVVCSANVTINKSGPASIGQGGTITYTVTVSNSGTASAPNVNITDDLDDSLTGVSASISGGVGAPACGVGALNVVTCGFDLSGVNSPTADHVAVITITATAPVGSCPLLSNQATGTYGRGTAISPSGIVTTQVTGCGGGVGSPGLSITKTADAASVSAGSPVGYVITVTSSGTVAALGVHLSDPLPTAPGMTWSVAGGSGAGSCSIGANVLNCNFGDMTPGAQFSVHVTSPTTAASCATLNNTANATSSNASTVSASSRITVTCASGIQVDKRGPAQAHVGDTITYTFDVSLIPNSPPLTNVTLTDPICDPTTLAGPTKTGGNQDAVLETGEVWSYSCTHQITTADPDPLPNTATATGTDPNGGTATGSGTHLVDIIHPDIDIVKVADPTSGSPGDVITYTYTVTNSGDVDLFNVSVDDNVLGHICDVALLHPQETVVCTGTYRIPKNSPLQITNIAIVGAADPLGDPVGARDEATIDVVLGTTVTPPTKTPPSGVAFTGSSAVLPLGALALVLLLLGSGMLWAGRGRETHAPGSDEG
jgi:uncharacterized repeat protein (TIGR01451 family)